MGDNPGMNLSPAGRAARDLSQRYRLQASRPLDGDEALEHSFHRDQEWSGYSSLLEQGALHFYRQGKTVYRLQHSSPTALEQTRTYLDDYSQGVDLLMSHPLKVLDLPGGVAKLAEVPGQNPTQKAETYLRLIDIYSSQVWADRGLERLPKGDDFERLLPCLDHLSGLDYEQALEATDMVLELRQQAPTPELGWDLVSLMTQAVGLGAQPESAQNAARLAVTALEPHHRERVIQVLQKAGSVHLDRDLFTFCHLPLEASLEERLRLYEAALKASGDGRDEVGPRLARFVAELEPGHHSEALARYLSRLTLGEWDPTPEVDLEQAEDCLVIDGVRLERHW